MRLVACRFPGCFGVLCTSPVARQAQGVTDLHFFTFVPLLCSARLAPQRCYPPRPCVLVDPQQQRCTVTARCVCARRFSWAQPLLRMVCCTHTPTHAHSTVSAPATTAARAHTGLHNSRARRRPSGGALRGRQRHVWAGQKQPVRPAEPPVRKLKPLWLCLLEVHHCWAVCADVPCNTITTPVFPAAAKEKS